jgi:hypothetical protein
MKAILNFIPRKKRIDGSDIHILICFEALKNPKFNKKKPLSNEN